MTGEDEAEVDDYFAPEFSFHGPDGRELDYQGLKDYFAALRAAFDDLSITRGIVVVEANYVACQTTITGIFVREFTHSPVGPLPPNGNRVVFELINIFRYNDAGCLSSQPPWPGTPANLPKRCARASFWRMRARRREGGPSCARIVSVEELSGPRAWKLA